MLIQKKKKSVFIIIALFLYYVHILKKCIVILSNQFSSASFVLAFVEFYDQHLLFIREFCCDRSYTIVDAFFIIVFFSLHLCVFMSCNTRVCVYNVYEIYVVSLYKKRNENQTIVRALTAFPTGDKKSTHTHTLKEMNEPRNQLEIINLSRVTYFLLSIFNIVSSWAHGTGIRMINRLQWANIMSYM